MITTIFSILFFASSPPKLFPYPSPLPTYPPCLSCVLIHYLPLLPLPLLLLPPPPPPLPPRAPYFKASTPNPLSLSLSPFLPLFVVSNRRSERLD